MLIFDNFQLVTRGMMPELVCQRDILLDFRTFIDVTVVGTMPLHGSLLFKDLANCYVFSHLTIPFAFSVG
jgi:hypothetical protein